MLPIITNLDLNKLSAFLACFELVLVFLMFKFGNKLLHSSRLFEKSLGIALLILMICAVLATLFLAYKR